MPRRRKGPSDIDSPDPTQLPINDIAHQLSGYGAADGQEPGPLWELGLPHVCLWALNTGPVIPTEARTTLFAIACRAKEDGMAMITQNELAVLTTTTRQTVSGHIHLLKMVGLLEVIEVIDNEGIHYAYRLTGVYDDWRLRPKDPTHKPTVLGALTARIEYLTARLAAVEGGTFHEGVEVTDLGSNGHRNTTAGVNGSNHQGVSENSGAPPSSSSRTESGSQINETKGSEGIKNTNTTTTEERGVVNNPDNPDSDGRFQRVHDFVYREDVWRQICRSPDRPRGWRSRPQAVSWYMTNFDTAPPGRMPFIEQEQLYTREAELEAEAELQRQQGEAEWRQRQAEQEEAEQEALREELADIDPAMKEIWRAVLGELQLQIPKPMFETWLRRTIGLRMDEESFVVGAPTPYAQEWLERRMYHAIQTIVQKVTAKPLEVRFQVVGGRVYDFI